VTSANTASPLAGGAGVNGAQAELFPGVLTPHEITHSPVCCAGPWDLSLSRSPVRRRLQLLSKALYGHKGSMII
jgi:hypothetical protein